MLKAKHVQTCSNTIRLTEHSENPKDVGHQPALVAPEGFQPDAKMTAGCSHSFPSRKCRRVPCSLDISWTFLDSKIKWNAHSNACYGVNLALWELIEFFHCFLQHAQQFTGYIWSTVEISRVRSRVRRAQLVSSCSLGALPLPCSALTLAKCVRSLSEGCPTRMQQTATLALGKVFTVL